MNYKNLSLLVFFSGIILLLVAMFIIPTGGCAEGFPDSESNRFFFHSAELFTVVGLIMYVIHIIKKEQRDEEEKLPKDSSIG